MANVLLGGGETPDLESGAQWPSVAVLFNVKLKTSCTVSIVSPRWLLTSHSCLFAKSTNPLEWVVFAGPRARDSAQIKIVKSIVSHPLAKHKQHLVSNDVALIELHESMDFNSLVSAICLADTEIGERQLCVTAGWTSSSEGKE